MPTPDSDSQISFEGGQDVSLPSTKLEPNKFVAGINVSTAKGVLRPRFGFCRKALNIQKGGYSYAFNKIADFNLTFRAGLFQAYAPYRIGNKFYQLVVICGLIYMIDQSDFSVRVITLNANTQVNPVAKRINWFVAAKYIVFCDFPNRPVIVENGVARRSRVSLNELPVLSLGTYNQNRAMFSNASNEFTGGDPAGSLSAPLAPITINEILAGGPFAADIYKAPTDHDSPLTTLTTLQSIDTSTGIGSLIAASSDQIFSYDTTQPRVNWSTENSFGTCLSYQAGIVDQRAQININSDLFFVSKDGALRALSSARDEQYRWARTPMTLPAENWIQYYDPDLIKYSRICYFKNKIYWTVRPTRVVALRLDGSPILDAAHAGLLVLDMSNVARGQEDIPTNYARGINEPMPAWDGIWLGVKPMEMMINDDRMFIMSKDSGTNQIYEVTPDQSIDRTDEGYRRPIRSIVYTRDYFVKNIFQDKELVRFESNITDILGKFKYKVKYKPSDAPSFIDWGTFELDVLNGYTDFPKGVIKERTPVALKELNLLAPNVRDASNPVTKDLFQSIKRVQFRLELEGDSWQLNEFAIFANLKDIDLTKKETQQITEDVEAFKNLTGDFEYKEFGL